METTARTTALILFIIAGASERKGRGYMLDRSDEKEQRGAFK